MPVAASFEKSNLFLQRQFSFGRILPITIALLAAAPIITVLASVFGHANNLYLASASGLSYASGTLALCFIVGIGATILGGGGAALIALTDFPGRRFFSFALVLPFAIPSYIVAYTYTDLLSPLGPMAALPLPEIRTLPGAAFILTLGVYPYVYLAMRAALAARSEAYIQAAKSLGASPIITIRRVILPLSRPALAGGLALALMETTADYGVADYFGVKTLSTGIFRTWYGLGDLTAASQLAAGLFMFAVLFVLMEQLSRHGLQSESARAPRQSRRIRLSSLHAVMAICFCSAPVLLGFVTPVLVLFATLPEASSIGAVRGLSEAIINTSMIALIGAGLTIFLAIILAYTARHQAKDQLMAATIRIATLGYALPGAVIAIGILTVVNWTPFLSTVSAGVFLLIYAYAARFLTAGYNSIAGGLTQIAPEMDAAAKTLGANPTRTAVSVHLPLSRNAIAAGALIIFIDIAKELPATLLLRPFDYETIATRVYRLASDERLADSSPAALVLVLIGSLAVILLETLAKQKRYSLTHASKQSQI